MSGPKRRVVITGVGAVTPLGTGNETFWSALIAGKSGVSRPLAFPTGGAGAHCTAEVRDFDPKHYIKQRKSLKVMARDIQLAVAGAQICIDDAALDHRQVDPTRFGVNCGAGLIASELDELGVPISHSVNGTRRFDLKRWGSEGLPQLFPLWMLKYLPNMPACHISINYDAQGPNNSITAGEASATLAMGEAFRSLSRGAADVFIVGGTDSKINPLSVVRLALLNRLSRRDGDPAEASRPFDADRDGAVAGEGAGLLLFEDLDHARRRGANIYAEVVGFGASCHPQNAKVAIELACRRAIEDAGLTPAQLGHVVPNGLSCVNEDRVETMALASVLGDVAPEIPIIAYKSYWGLLAAASGAVELIASVLALKSGVLPATLNFRRPDPDLPRLRILSEPMPCPKRPFLTYDVSHSGQCGALVVRPFEG